MLNKQAADKVLSEVRSKKGVTVMKSGLLIETYKSTSKSNAKSPKLGDECIIEMKGYLPDGTLIDPDLATTIKIIPGELLTGLREGLQYMAEGDRFVFHLPPDLAYGQRGNEGKVPPLTPIHFFVEMLQVDGNGKSRKEARKLFGGNRLYVVGEDGSTSTSTSTSGQTKTKGKGKEAKKVVSSEKDSSATTTTSTTTTTAIADAITDAVKSASPAAAIVDSNDVMTTEREL